ncbi:MAG: DUF1638 domain-containing protein [Anaerolineae bacterium]|nr:DUF1638 domain-containing protein [Anaerolineae bacterium]
MNPSPPRPFRLCLLTCDFFAKEVAAVIAAEGWSDVDSIAFPARCGRPPLSDAELSELVKGRKYDAVHIIGGRCACALCKPPEPGAPDVVYTLEPCLAVLAGQTYVQHLIRSGTYLLSPGWLAQWPENLKQWGFEDQALARAFFAEFASRLALLDSGIDPDAGQKLSEFAAFLDLPYQTIPVGLDFLREMLAGRIVEWRLNQEKQMVQRLLVRRQKQAADYAMILTLFNELSRLHVEQLLIARILDTFMMLFAPRYLLYLPFHSGQPGSLQSYAQPVANPEPYRQAMANLSEDYVWAESQQGFMMRIAYGNETVGGVLVEEIAFPEYKEHYIEMARGLADVCGLAIANARMYQHMQQLVDDKVRELETERAKVIQAGKLAALGEMATGIAHELNQPLTAILFDVDYIETALRKNRTAVISQTEFFDKLDNVAKSIKENIARCTRIINHLRTFGRVSTGEAYPIQVEQPLEGALSLVRERLRNHGIHLQWDLAPNLPLIQADPQRLEQVFINLINNAEYAMREMEHRIQSAQVFRPDYDKILVITVAATADHVVVKIADSGCGIPASVRDHIFEPFFTTKPAGEGTGLGLSISYGIVRETHGEISFESEENVGTTFTLRFPILARND